MKKDLFQVSIHLKTKDLQKQAKLDRDCIVQWEILIISRVIIIDLGYLNI